MLQKINEEVSAFTLSSVSKVFTAAAILQLRDKKKLQLDDTLVKYLPGFPYPGITIRHLLSHTSGLPDYELLETQIEQNPGKIFSNKDIMPALVVWHQPLRCVPGDKWIYSNINYILLAILIEKISNLGFEKYIQQNIFTPSGMRNTYFQASATPAQDKHRTVNQDYPFLFSTSLQNADSIKKYRWRLYNASGFVGQGNIISTTGDMLKFDHALNLGKILANATLQEAFTPVLLNNGKPADAGAGFGPASYGLGWFIGKDSSQGKLVWHTGGQPGGLSLFVRNIAKKQMLIMFDNAFHLTLYGHGANAMNILINKPIVTRKISLVKQYGTALTENGIDAAFCILQQLKADTAHYYLNEDDMNELGLQLLYAATFPGHDTAALEVLKLNSLFFPESFNTWDSYGEALAKTGRKTQAIYMYKRSLQLNPENEGGKKALEVLQK